MKTWQAHYEITSKTIRRDTINALFSILFALMFGELFARYVDPIGVHRYYAQFPILKDAEIQDDQRVFTYRPGAMHFETWTAQIDASGNRAVPHAIPGSSCTIATISDSITFGAGVEDDQTWPDLVAQSLGTVNVINPSRPGYNARNFSPLIHSTPADGYIYLAISNDANAPAS